MILFGVIFAQDYKFLFVRSFCKLYLKNFNVEKPSCFHSVLTLNVHKTQRNLLSEALKASDLPNPVRLIIMYK